MKFLAALLIATTLAAPLALRAQTTLTWTGAAGNNLWTDADNWDLLFVPNTYDNVVIAGSTSEVVVPFGTNLMLGTFWGDYTPTTATVNSGATLRVAGSLRTNAGLNNDVQQYIFNGTSTLAIDDGGFIQHGHYIFNDSSQLTAAGADAVRVGSIIRFYGNSGFGSLAAGAFSGGTATFYGSREVTFTPGAIVGGYINLADTTSATLNQTGTFVGNAENPSLYFQLRDNATATVSAAGAMQNAELSVGGSSTAYLNATGAIVNGSLFLETNGTVIVGADNPLTNSRVSFADWTGGNTGGTLDLNGHTFTVTGAHSMSGPSNPANEGTITSATAATLVFNVSADNEESSGGRYHGAITGAVSVVKNGTGTQYLGTPADPDEGYAASTLSYTGTTTVNAGRLYINAPLTNSAVIVNSGGLLGGTGSMTSITVNSGGTLDPSPATIDSTGATGTLSASHVAFASGANFLFNLGDANGTAGATFDWDTQSGGWSLLDVANTLALPGNGDTLNLLITTGGYRLPPDWDLIPTPANFDPAANYSFRFASAGSITGFESTLFNIGYDPQLADRFYAASYFTGTWSVSMHDNSLYLNYTGASAVPEPSTYAATLAAVALCVAAIRRRKTANPAALN